MVEPVLIKKSKKEESFSDVQEANANTLADLRLKENLNLGPVYIVTVEDPTVRSKKRSFVSLKLREDSPVYLDLIGIEVDSKEKSKFSSYQEVENYIQEKGSVSVVNIRFPWTRVINMENRSYKKK